MYKVSVRRYRKTVYHYSSISLTFVSLWEMPSTFTFQWWLCITLMLGESSQIAILSCSYKANTLANFNSLGLTNIIRQRNQGVVRLLASSPR